jgi:hypothetical protein
MQSNFRGIVLAMSLAALSSASAYSQKTSTDATTPAPVAAVYIQGHDGIYVYNVSAAGKLTAVKGSPVWVSGNLAAMRGSYLISAGTDNLRTYKIESTGLPGGKVGEIDTQSYGGSKCGTIDGGTLLDHTGEYLAVPLYGGPSCAALQTFKIASDGQFTFLGDSQSTASVHSDIYQVDVSTFSSNDLFAYGVQAQQGATSFLAYKRAAAGDLVADESYTEKDPTPDPVDSNYAPWVVAADSASHLAVVMNQPFGPACCSTFSLASYTINNQTGAIASTNTYLNMPVLKIYADDIAMNWGGSLVAVGGSPGLQLFHFNGAAPATAFGGVLLPKVEIDQVTWDKNNHLFAFSYASQELYVYTVTSTSVTEAPGSPYKANNWDGLIVVPKS